MADSTTPQVQGSETPAPAQAPSMAPATTTWQPPTNTPRKRRRRTRRIVAAAAVAAYLLGALYFNHHFTPRTTVDGVDAGLMTKSQLSEALLARSLSYEQHLHNADGFDLALKGSDVGLATDCVTLADTALERTSALLWLPNCLTHQNIVVDENVTVDADKVSQLVSKAVESYNANAEQPTNASGHYDKESKTFVVDNETVGTALDPQKVTDASVAACQALSEELTLDESVLLQPEVSREDETLLASVQKANDILDKPLELQADGETIATISRNRMGSWMSIQPDQSLDINGITLWASRSPKIVDAGNAHDDEHVWQLDAQGTGTAIYDAMLNLSGGSVEIVRDCIETKPPVTPGAKERGRHVDINLTTQFVRFYDTDGTVIWDSYCVTGGWDWEFQEMHYTPTGTFAIETKETNRTLIGADRNNDGKPDYESFVYFWMPFLNYDYGLHDATWRYDDGFGGDVYTYYGSHGCVNLPYAKAEELFGLINVGDIVYIHYSDDNGASWYGPGSEPAEEPQESVDSQDSATTDEGVVDDGSADTTTYDDGASEGGASDYEYSEGGYSEESEYVDYSGYTGDDSYNGA